MLNNDWIVANINNPDYSTEMFKMKGIDTDNTQMLREESYLKSNFIINNPAFADNNGNFNKDKFHDYYQQQATKWGELQKDKSVHTVYDMFDVRQAPGDQIYNPFTGTTQGMKTDKQNPLGSFIKLTSNPTNQGVGISGFQEISKQSKSTREIAQGQNIFDSSTGKFLNETPDSISLFSNPIKYIKQIFSDPLVLATYDSDGESIDPISGKKLKHSKGEIKLNSNGKPYYETLNGRNPATKQVLSMGDIVTSEASSLNKYDFIDSDDMDKSVTGTILKNVASVLPLAVPYVGEAYSAGLVVRELAKTTPMLYGMIKSLFSDKSANSQFLNSLQGRATAMSGSVSDAGQSAMWTWEGVFNMMGDVATQWGQQKAVANWTKKLITGKQDLSKVAEEEAKALYESKLQSVLNNANTAEDRYKALSLYGMEEGQIAKILEQEGKAVGDAWKQTSIGSAALRKTFDVYKPRIEKLNRLGANASLAYMALVSNTDVYQSMLDAGATPREAAAVALGSTLGMYTVDRLGIGEMFFDELAKNDMRQIRTALLGEKENWAKALGISTKNIPENTNKFKKLILSGRDKMVKALQDYADDIKYHTTSAVGKAIGEGLEEVSEELVTDMSKATYEMLHNFGITTQANVGAFNYDQNLNGEGKGGYNIAQLLSRYGMSFIGGTLGGGMFYGVGVLQGNNFHINKDSGNMLYLTREGKAEDMVNTIEQMRKKGQFGSTTISATNATTDSEGQQVNITVDGDLSINDYIAKRLTNQIRSYQTIMDDNNLNKSDEDLFNQMIMQDKIFRNLQGYLQEESYITRYQQTWQKLAQQVVIAQKGLEVAVSAKNGEIPKELIPELATASSSKELIDKLGEARLLDSTERHNSGEEAKRNQNVAAWQDYLNNKKQELLNFESPENSSYYTEMLMFGIDPIISSTFGTYDFNSWLYNTQHGLTVDKLTQPEIEQYKADYQTYQANAQPLDLQESFKLFKDWQQKIDPYLQQMAQQSQNYDSYQKEVQELFKDGIDWYQNANHLENKQWYESDEEYAKSKQQEGESAQDYKIRQEQRKQEINTKVEQKLQDLVNFVNTHILDPITSRQIKTMLAARIKDIRKNVVLTNFSVQQDNLIKELSGDSLKDYKGNDIESLRTAIIGTKEDLGKIDQYFGKLYGQFIHPDYEYNEDLNVMIPFTSLFNTNTDSFSNIVVTDLLNQKVINEDALPEFDGTKIEKIQNLLRLASIGLDNIYRGSDSRYQGKSYKYILTEVFGKDTVDRIENSIENSKYVDPKTDQQYNLQYINPYKYIANGEQITDELIENWLQENKDVSNNSIQSLIKLQPLITNKNGNFDDARKSVNDSYKAFAKEVLDNAEKSINSNLLYQTLVGLTESLPNPIVELAKHLPVYNENVESVIQKMYQHFEDDDDINTFQLTGQEMQSLQQVQTVLNLASTYMRAASTDQDLTNIYGHNKTINRFNQEHKIKANPLAEIDENYANIYQIEIGKYLNMIDPNSYSLPFISNINQGNIIGQFDQAKEKFTQTKKEFFNSNRNNFEACKVIA